MEKVALGTPDLTDENITKIGELFPQVITEAEGEDGALRKVVDFDALKQELTGGLVEGTRERYQFTWPGKQAAKLEARRPINKTLRPCREESAAFDTTENLYIEGDNLDALKLLRTTYAGKVKMIYIDPPYNTGNDFIYDDDFSESAAEYAERGGDYDYEGGRLVANLSSNGRFHSDWCSMMYPRLLLAKDLLSSDGVLFVSIDDNEMVNLECICREIFGATGFVGQIAVVNNKKGRNDKENIATCHEYLVAYSKTDFKARGIPLTDEQRALFSLSDESGKLYQLRDLRRRGQADRREDRPNMFFPIFYNETTGECSLEAHEGWQTITPQKGDGSDGRWRWGKERVGKCLSILEPKYSSRSGRWGISYRVYLNPSECPAGQALVDEEDEKTERESKVKSFWIGGELSTDVAKRDVKALFDGLAVFDTPKAIELLKRAVVMGANQDSIILDFFSGSAALAHAVIKLNSEDGGCRKFILAQIPDGTPDNSEAYKAGYSTIAEIGKERIRRAGTKIKEEAGLLGEDLDIGFRVLKIDSSNFVDTYKTPDATSQESLFELASNLKADRSSEDLLFEVLPAFRIPLSAKIIVEEIGGKQVFNVNDGQLLACFDTAVTTETVEAVAKQKPLYTVFRDASFADDSAVANFEELFKTYSPDTVRKVV